MLKIKDNVDLKELEKFGFKLDYELSDDEQIYSVKQKYQRLCVEFESRELYLYEEFMSNAFMLKNNVIYDLIKADLVEKVEE